MGFVRTAYGIGRIVAEDNIGRGRKQFKVEGANFSIWLDDTKIVHADVDEDRVDESNSVRLPYNPEPQHKDLINDSESTIQPDAAGDVQDRKEFALDRTHPANSVTFDRTETSEAGSQPGPNPFLFAPGGGGFRGEYPAQAKAAGALTDALVEMLSDGGRPTDLEGAPEDLYDVVPSHEWANQADAEHGWTPHGHEWADELSPAERPDFSGEGQRARQLELFTRPANLDPKYAFPSAPIDYSDSVFQFRNDPIAFMNRTAAIQGEPSEEVGRYQLLVEADHQIREAAWKDVRAKALRLRQEGRVHVKDIDSDRIYASVEGDNNTYDVMIVKGSEIAPSYQGSGTQSISNWRCACDWGKWAFKRRIKYVGRLCSHGLAAYHEMQSQHLAKRTDPSLKGNPYRLACGDAIDARNYEEQENEDRPELKHVGERLRLTPTHFEPEFHEISDSHELKTVDVTKDKDHNVGKDITAYRYADALGDFFGLDDENQSSLSSAGVPSVSSPGGGPQGIADTSGSTRMTDGFGKGAPDFTTTDLGGGPGSSSAPSGSADPQAFSNLGPSSGGSDFGWGGASTGVGNSAGADTSNPNIYTVQPGDTLSGIAESHGGGDYNNITNAGGGEIGNKDLITPGQQLDLSGAGGTWGGSSSSSGSSSSAPSVGIGNSVSGDTSSSQVGIGNSAGADSSQKSNWFAASRKDYVRWLLAAPEATSATEPPSEEDDATQPQPAATPAQPAGGEDAALNAGGGFGSGGSSLGDFGSSSGGSGGFGMDQFMDMASPFIDAGAGVLSDIGGSFANSLGSGLSNIFTGSLEQEYVPYNPDLMGSWEGMTPLDREELEVAYNNPEQWRNRNIAGPWGSNLGPFRESAKDTGLYESQGHHEPFNGFGGDPYYDDFGSSEDYIKANEPVGKREDVDDLEGDVTKYTPGRDKVGSLDESRAEMHARENAELAERAAAFLRTAGRKYTQAEQDELINESHPLGARNLASLDLEGTHYLSE